MKNRKARIWWEGHPEWVKYVEENCSSKTDKEIATHLSKLTDKYHIDARTIKMLRNQKRWLGVPSPGVRWRSPEIEKFIRENWPAMDDNALAKAIKEKLVETLGKKKAAKMLVKKSTVKSYREAMGCMGNNNKIPPPKEIIDEIEKLRETHSASEIGLIVGISHKRVTTVFANKGWPLKYPRIEWPKAVNQYVKKHFKTKSNSELAVDLNRLFPRGELKGTWTALHISGQLSRRGLERTREEIIAGKRRAVKRGISKVGGGASEFEDGTITIRKYTKKNGAVVFMPWIKIGKDIRPLKQVVWAHSNGQIPKHHFVNCKDGDEMNTVIDNLEIIDSTKSMVVAMHELSDNYVIASVSRNDPNYREFLHTETGKSELEFQKARLKFKRILKNAIANAK